MGVGVFSVGQENSSASAALLLLWEDEALKELWGSWSHGWEVLVGQM